MKNHYFILLFVLFHLILVNCEEEAKLDIEVRIDDDRSSFEVFKSKENDLIINGGKIHDFRKLKWYSMGKPIVILTKSEKYKSESFVHLQSEGFYLNIQILSEEHKKLIIKSINETHGIPVELFQIEEIPLKEFKCDFHLYLDDKESILKGVAKAFTRFPLKVHFLANENEIKFLYYSLLNNLDELQLDCQYKSEINGLDKTLIVEFEKEITVIEFSFIYIKLLKTFLFY
jgi:hypothetical protein